MVNKKISDGVGKKIVEALKKQSEIEVNAVSTHEQEDELEAFAGGLPDSFESDESDDVFHEEDFMESLSSENYSGSSIADENDSFVSEETPTKPMSQPFINYQQPSQSVNDNFIKELDTFEIPSNIAVLKKLISQLPSGVTRHTGAQIIKQTMEALGISMKSVLQEAQQVQDGLSNSAKECHATIQEYKKQITMLEKQAQNHQRQYTALNELISLFVQTGL
ncbi:MAG: hypothetical protein WCG95_08625 [bacterium]